MSNQNKIQCRQVGDYLIPNLILPPEEASVRLGKWGIMYKDYLEKHNPILFNSLLIEGKLYRHCSDIDNQVREMFNILIEQMRKSEGVTEELKEHNQWDWVQKMGNIQQRANEIVCKELIYV